MLDRSYFLAGLEAIQAGNVTCCWQCGGHWKRGTGKHGNGLRMDNET